MNDRLPAPITLSIGVMAWNEEDSICTTLTSLFQQSVFARLAARGDRCEVIVLANGCTDATVPLAQDFLAKMEREHPFAATFSARVMDLPEPGRNHTWNRFVHEFSA